MKYSQELSMKQTQSLALTPEMRQSLSVLQMSCTELEEFLNQEMMENPLLEIDEDKGRQTLSDDIQKISWTAYVESCESGRKSLEKTDAADEDTYTFEKYSHSDMNYHEILDMQFNLLKSDLTARQIRIGNALLDQINDDGYLFADLEDLAASLNVYPDEIDEVLTMIQGFYPSGTGARSVEECLYLQLRELTPVSADYQTLLFHHLEDAAEHRFQKIERQTGIPAQTQINFLNDLKSLHPRPGSSFGSTEQTFYVVPDGSISWIGNTLSVKLNNIGTPPLIINPIYQKMLSDQTLPPQTREYISERLSRAMTLLHNIEARAMTIESIASAIAEKQRMYLLGVTNMLNPLTQKQIAEETGLHESTVSRTVRGKYFLTPRGTLELKSLFCTCHEKGGITITTEAIKQEIRTLISKEDAAHPLTDQKIADYLSAEVFTIARRTVAKYREEMGIRTASKRRAAVSCS